MDLNDFDLLKEDFKGADYIIGIGRLKCS